MARPMSTLLISIFLFGMSLSALAEMGLEGRWEGFQGKDRQVAVTLQLNSDGGGVGEFRRDGVSKVGKATISDIVLDGNNITYIQHYTDAILQKVTGSTAKIELVLSSDGKHMIGQGTNLTNRNTFKVELFKK